jgi:hypothetical protein
MAMTTAKQLAQGRLAQNNIQGTVAFVQGLLRVRTKFTVRTEAEIAQYTRRIESAIPGLEVDNGFLDQREFPFPSNLEIWFRLTGEAARSLGTTPTPQTAEAPLASPVGRIYQVGRRNKQDPPGGGTQPMTQVSNDPSAELENLQTETAGQTVAEQAPSQTTETAGTVPAAPTTNGAAPNPTATGPGGRPPQQPLPEITPAVQAILDEKNLSDSEKARRLVLDHGYSIANAAKQLSITRGKPMRYQQVYQSLHGKEMRAARDAKQAGKSPEEIQAARAAAVAGGGTGTPVPSGQEGQGQQPSAPQTPDQGAETTGEGAGDQGDFGAEQPQSGEQAPQ